MAARPRVLLRKMVARTRWKGVGERCSWTRPKEGEERGGKGMQDVGGGRVFLEEGVVGGCGGGVGK